MRSCNGTLSLVGKVVRAIDLGNRARISYSDIVSGQRLTSVMVIGLPVLYVKF